MSRTFTLAVALLTALALHSGQALAAENGHAGHSEAEHDEPERVGDPYPLKVDPLGDSLVEAEKPIVIVHDGRELRFASEENLKAFKAEPDEHLDRADRMIVEQQKPAYPLETCVVSGQELGAMGEPVDVVHGNRLLRFCCSGCSGMLKKNPAKYFGKLDAAVIEAQKADYPMQTCVISGEPLDAMGEPVDYVIGTRLVRFCCSGCENMFEKNPAKRLAAIDAHRKGQGEHRDGGHEGHQGHGNHSDAHGHEQHHEDNQ